MYFKNQDKIHKYLNSRKIDRVFPRTLLQKATQQSDRMTSENDMMRENQRKTKKKQSLDQFLYMKKKWMKP